MKRIFARSNKRWQHVDSAVRILLVCGWALCMELSTAMESVWAADFSLTTGLQRVVKGGRTERETGGNANYVKPTWSPGADYLAFETLAEKQRRLFVYDRKSGMALEQVSTQAAPSSPNFFGDMNGTEAVANFDLTWNRNSVERRNSLRAFVGSGDEGYFGLYTANAKGKPDATKVKGHLILGGRKGSPYVAFPNYHPESNFLIYCQGKGPYATEEARLDLYWLDGTGKSDMFKEIENLPQLEPSFSPLGDAIAFTGIEEGNNDIYVMDVRIKSLPLGTTVKVDGVKRLTNWPSPEGRPIWSPDGKKIAFLSGKGERDKEWGLWVVDAKGQSPPTKLVSRVLGEDYPEWHPDGEHIFFVKILEEERNPIQYVNIHDKKVGTLATGTALHTHLDISDDGSEIVFCARGQNEDRNLTWLKLYVAGLQKR